MNKSECSAVVLAGGQGSRLGYVSKGELLINGERFIDRMARELKDFGELLLSTNTENLAENTAYRAVPDIIEKQGPLGGIYSALRECKYPYLFVVACDMPYFTGELASLVLDSYRGEGAVIVRTMDGRIHPLCGLYKKECLEVIEQNLEHQNLKLTEVLNQLNHRVIEVPEHMTSELFNVNYPKDLEELGGLINK